MPALKPTALPEGFTSARQTGNAFNETRDCTVVAMHLTTGLPYEACREFLAQAGRSYGKGLCRSQQREAYRLAGFNMRRWTAREMVDMVMSYPKKGIAGITTHQPRRFPKQWEGKGNLTIHSRGHVSAFVDGVVQDWAINKALRVQQICSIERIED